MNIVSHRTPDCGWAWVISVSCATINGLTFGLIRSFGVFFFYVRKEFSVSRQVASWPFALCTSCTYLSGSITGFLISYFNLRTIVFVGILFTSLGFSLCFFISDLSQIVILIGFVHGFGIGLSFMQTPVILAQYFNKYHATATAISYAGGTVGSFLFPPLIEESIKHYGLKGSFLIIGAILLNGLPCALLLRPPIPSDGHQTYPPNGNNGQQFFPSRSIRSIHHKLRRKKNERWFHLRKSSIDLFAEKLNSKSNLSLNTSDNILKSVSNVSFSLDNVKIYKKQTNNMANDFNETEVLLVESIQLPNNNARANNLSDKDHLESTQEELTPAGLAKKITKNKYCQTIQINTKQHFFRIIFSIITNPMYIILLITHVSFQWAWMTYQMVIFDFGIDQELTRSQSVFILISFALFDLFGRIISGYMADKKIIKKNHIVSICILIIGFLILVTSMIDSYQLHITFTILLGFTCGVIIVLFNLLTMEYVGLDKLPVALGVSAFFVGVTSLFRPYVIGLFRDVIGSYDGLFQFVGTLSLIAALLWLMEPFAILSFKRRSNRKYIVP